MKCKIFYFCLNLFCGLLLSCHNDLFDALNKVEEYPDHPQSPGVISFAKKTGIQIQWDDDNGADEYIIYRSNSPKEDFKQVVYQGSSNQFVDFDVVNNQFYYYKLAKKKGKKEFEQSPEYSCGITGEIMQDEYEANDVIDQATQYYGTITSNIFYYVDEVGNAIEDVDWYFVVLGPNKTLRITFELEGLEDGDIAFNIQGSSKISIFNNRQVALTNVNSMIRPVYFTVSINKNKTSFNYKIGSYKLVQDSIF